MKTLPFTNGAHAHAAAGAPGGWLGQFLRGQAQPQSFGRRLWSYWPVACIFLAGAAAGHYTRPAPGTSLHSRPAAPGRYHVTRFDPGAFRFLMVDETTGAAWYLTDPNVGWLPLDPPRPLAPE